MYVGTVIHIIADIPLSHIENEHRHDIVLVLLNI